MLSGSASQQNIVAKKYSFTPADKINGKKKISDDNVGLHGTLTP
jgi:hypothetical protein